MLPTAIAVPGAATRASIAACIVGAGALGAAAMSDAHQMRAIECFIP
jgi:hypothetical protein